MSDRRCPRRFPPTTAHHDPFSARRGKSSWPGPPVFLAVERGRHNLASPSRLERVWGVRKGRSRRQRAVSLSCGAGVSQWETRAAVPNASAVGCRALFRRSAAEIPRRPGARLSQGLQVSGRKDAARARVLFARAPDARLARARSDVWYRTCCRGCCCNAQRPYRLKRKR